MLKRILARIRKFFASKLCLYINSNNVLPAPLDEATEMELLLKARDGDMEQKYLIVHNLRLVVYIMKFE